MKFTKQLIAGASLIAAALATPASAATYEYVMTNGDVLTINNETSSATMVGQTINVSMTSDDFATFAGGALPKFSSVLNSLDGTRLIDGNWITDNPLNADTTHPQKLISFGDAYGWVNLWAWWGDPIIGGDYFTNISSYSTRPTAVPEPGALGLMALGLLGFGFAQRRRRKIAA